MLGLQVGATMPSVHFRRDKIYSSFLKGSDAAASGVNSSVSGQWGSRGDLQRCPSPSCDMLHDMI